MIQINDEQKERSKVFSMHYPNFSGFNCQDSFRMKVVKINFDYHPFEDDKNGFYQVVYMFDCMGIEYEIYFVHTDKTGYTNHSLAEHGILL